MAGQWQELFEELTRIRVGVIGDVMLDSYIWGNVERISPEAPVPIVSLHHREQRIGGAGNVALNLRSLGATASVISVTGDDAEATALEQLFRENGIGCDYCLRSSSRVTTNKTRVISRNQHMMRLDAEHTHDLTLEEEDKLLQHFYRFIEAEQPQIIILEDYNKGVLTGRVIETVIQACRERGILTAVDPKRKNFLHYRGVDIFKPNLKEVKDALNLPFCEGELDLLKTVHLQLHEALQHNISLITLSEKGVFYGSGEAASIIPSHLRNIADVSGAGDTVIAVASLVYAATREMHLMAEMANIAGGLVCEEVGTAAINRHKLLHECEVLLG